MKSKALQYAGNLSIEKFFLDFKRILFNTFRDELLNRDLIPSLLCMQKVSECGHVIAIKKIRRALYILKRRLYLEDVGSINLCSMRFLALVDSFSS